MNTKPKKPFQNSSFRSGLKIKQEVLPVDESSASITSCLTQSDGNLHILIVHFQPNISNKGYFF